MHDLHDSVTENGAWPITNEIAHIALLPPTTDDLALQANVRVLLQCVPGYQCEEQVEPDDPSVTICTAPTAQKWGRSYTWNPDRPSTAAPVLVPPDYPQDGTQDLFCGGHCFDRDGHLVWLGGTDMLKTCQEISPGGPPACALSAGDYWGHRFAWRLDTASPVLTWSRLGQGQGADRMAFRRWYPTATLMNDGRVTALGHTLNPVFPAPQGAAFHRDEYDAVSDTWASNGYPNEGYGGGAGACPPGDDFNTGDYPRVHLLSTGELFHANVYHPNDAIIPMDRYLDVGDQPWSCTPHGPGVQRWREGNDQPEERLLGGSVHLITWDPMSGDFTEVIYRVGGSREPFDGNACEGDPGDPLDPSDVLASVDRIQDPTAKVPVDWNTPSAPASMNYSRANHNTVILLDGSIGVFGGVGLDVPGTCTFRCVPERYEPEEVFGNAAATWQVMEKQPCPRGYHSVAVLLPDGRVVTGGGFAPDLGFYVCSGKDSRYTVQTFSPPYFFAPNRPVIDIVSVDPALAKAYDDVLAFEVQTEPGHFIDRVALIRNGSATHAFDMDQRYVELIVDPVFTVEGTSGAGDWHVEVTTPLNEFWAPPGYFLLTVVDNAQRPAEAVWIRLES